MADIDYGALFGIDEGANVTEVAEPSAAEPDTAQGVKEQEVSEETEIAEPADSTQTKEDNARFAAARRKAEAERDAAVAKAKADAQRTIDEAFKNSGLKNPYTQQPITSKAEYDEYRRRYEKEKTDRVLKKSGMTKEEFTQWQEQLPIVRQAREAQRAAREREAKVKIGEQIREITELDPGVKELSDLAKMENYPRLYELVKRGNTLTDAYKLANMERLTQNAAAASRQTALNAARGKQHMAQTHSRGMGAISVPAGVKAAYREFNPDATDAEIQKHYNKYINR